MDRRKFLTRTGWLGVGGVAAAWPFVVTETEADAGSGAHTHPDYEARLDALEAAVFAPEPEPEPTVTPTATPTLIDVTVIRDCLYDGNGWMPSSHVSSGDVDYVQDPLGGDETVARYHSHGRAENWHSDHIQRVEQEGFDDRTYIYSGGFMFPDDWRLSDPNWHIFRQWHNGDGSPGFSFQTVSDHEARLIRRRVNGDGSENDETVAAWGIDPDTWYDYSALVIWQKDGSGRFQLRIDGQKVADYEGPTLKPDAGTLYGKNGGYQSGGETVSFARRLFIGRSETWDESLHTV